MKKIVLLAFLGASVLLAMQPEPALVAVEKVKKDIVSSAQNFTGTVQFAQSAKLAVEGSGKVVKINFDVGDTLKKGDTLLQIDTQLLEAQKKSLEASLEAAKVELKNAQTDFNRYEELIKQNSVAKKVYDDSYFRLLGAKANLERAKASLDQVQIQIDKATLKAPFDGVVSAKNVEIGEWVTSGNVVANLVSTKEVELIFNLPTLYVGTVEVGQKYEVKIGDKSYFASLSAKVAQGDIKTRTFPVKFTLEVDGFVYEGMEASVSLPKREEGEHLVVPRDAIINRFGNMVIFVVIDGVAQLRPVSIIGYSDTSVAIETMGVNEGMDVITKGNERVFPEQPVIIVN